MEALIIQLNKKITAETLVTQLRNFSLFSFGRNLFDIPQQKFTKTNSRLVYFQQMKKNSRDYSYPCGSRKKYKKCCLVKTISS